MTNKARRNVLIAGAQLAGLAAFPSLATCQQNNPTLLAGPGEWKMSTPMPKAMGEVVSVSLGKKLFVFGGLNDAAGEVPYGAAFKFDDAGWAALPNMPEPAHHLMITTCKEKIYIFGGFTLGDHPKMSWKPHAGSWLFDPNANTYKRLAPLPRPRGAGYAVTVDDRILVIGGVAASGGDEKPIALAMPEGQIVTGFVDEYDPQTDTWRPRASMPTPRNHYLAATVDGKVYALNGRTGSVFVNMSSTTDLIEMYDPKSDSWTLVGRSPTNRGDVNGAAYKGKIYVTGGEYETSKYKKTFWAFEAFDTSRRTWQELNHVQISRHGFGAAFVENNLHVVGGSFQSDGMPGVYSPTATHEVFEVA